MESTELISALAKVVDAKKATDKAYRTLSKAFLTAQTMNCTTRL